MLEKIGLPPRPSMPGGNWVLDASHCQVCQSQFTFFNRKHHCRRCGGLFCNNCTQQRIILRGQGDSPVRICEPCKKIEEAARIELRHGHRTRKAKANSKKAAKNEDQILQEFIEGEKFPLLVASAETDLQEARSSMASSSMQEVPQSPDRIEDIIRIASSGPHNNVMNEVGSSSPEELRRLAQEEKNKHRILKSQGKPDEALAAFKRGKELERQAASLEITLRKNRRLASMQKTSIRTDDGELLTDKKQIPSRTSKSKKDDLANELKELGWSDADAHEAERKPEKQSIESELSSLLRGSHTEKKVSSIDKSQVIAHKKRALELKREGKLAEAKEELKQAKILEKQLEEQEFLAEGDESDDEIAALIRSMGDDKHDVLSFDDILPEKDMNFNFANLGDDFSLETKFDITDDDLNDPEMAAALKSFGWSEEDAHLEEDVPEADSEVDHKILAEEVLALKREAVKHKKAGNLPVAMELLKKAKILEKELESLQCNTSPMQKNLETPSPGEQLLPTNSNVSAAATPPSDHKQPPKSKAVIQRELLALKRKALALKREGHVEEAEEELRRGKVLELQLEEMEKVPKPLNAKELDKKNILAAHPHEGAFVTADLPEVDNADVTDQDMEDPALLSVLKNLGWEDNPEAVDGSTEMPVTTSGQSKAMIDPLLSLKPTKSKSEIQKELLAIKRRALAFRRQGKVEESDEELRKTADLENQLKDLEAKHQTEQFAERDNSSILSVRSESIGEILKNEQEVKHQHDHFKKSNDETGSSTWPDTSGREISNDQKEYIHRVNPVASTSEQVKDQNNHDYTPEIPGVSGDQQTSDSINFKESSKGINSSQVNNEKNYGVRFVSPDKVVRSRGEIQKELLAIKRKAHVLRRQGKLAEADEELAKAKDLEDRLDAIYKIEKEHGSLPHVQKEEKVDDVLSALMKSNDETGSSTWPDTSGREVSNDQKEYIHRVNPIASTSEQVKDQNNHDYTPEIPGVGGDQQTSDSINFKESSKGINSSQVNNEKNYGVRFVSPDKVVRSRGEIQKELLAIKRKAHVLNRQGKLAEADEELAKAKDLEDQLDAIDKIEKEHGSLPHVQKEGKVDDVLSVLMNVDSMHKDVAADSARYPEGNHEVKPPFASFSMKNDSSDGHHDSVIVPPPREPVNLIDLLTGDNQTKISSESVAVVSLPINSDMLDLLSSDDWNNQPFLPNKLDQDARPFYLTLDDPSPLEVAVDSKTSDHLPDQGPTLKNDNKALHSSPNLVFSQNEVNEASPMKGMETSATKSNTPHEPSSLKDQILAHKRRALMLKREGKLAEAREELKQAKLLERTMEGDVKQTNEDNQRVITSVSADVPVTRKSEKENVPVSQKSIQETNVPSQKPMSGRDRFKLQQECLSKKRQAAKLRREGKMDEAESLLEQAKNLQAQIEEIDSMNPNASGKQVEDDALVEDLLDPQLLSALQSIGIGVEKNMSQPPKRTEAKPSGSKMDSKLTPRNMEVNVTVSNAGSERVQLEEQIKAEKVRALNFKRAGKQAEAMEALRSAKRLEKKLASLG